MPSSAARIRQGDAALCDALGEGERALHVEGNLVLARKAFETAFEQAEQNHDAEAMARAALGSSGLWVHERRGAADAARVAARQRHALARLAPSDPLTLRLRIRLGAEADYRAGTAGRMLELLEQARARHSATEHAGTVLAEALSLAHHCVLGPEHGSLRLRLAEELIEVGAGTDRPGDTVMGMLWRTVDLLLAGDRQAERAYADLLEYGPAHRHAVASYTMMAIRVMLTVRAGALADAEALAEECARAGAAVGDTDWMGWYAAQLLTVRWYQGRIAEVVDTVASMVNSPTLSVVDSSFVAVQAAACAAAGQQRQARGALARICGPDGASLADLPPSSSWLIAVTAVIEAAALLEDPATASRAYQLLRPHADLPVMASLAVACLGSAHQPLGVACLVTGEVEIAVAHLEAAMERNGALGHWPALTLSRHRLAQALAARAGPGDARRAGTLFEEAEAEATEFGMRLPPPAVAAPARPSRAAVCIRAGRRWRIEWRGRSAVIDDMVGVRHLAVLIANPGVDVAAIDLAEPSRGSYPSLGPQPMLDPQAIGEYRTRLRELGVELARPNIERRDGGRAGDGGRHSALEAEAEWLRHELSASTGLGGRARPFADDTERARIAVGKAIRRALDRVAAVDAVLGKELKACVDTGSVCCYRPWYR